MPTGQQIVSNALTILGILEQGGVPSGSDSADSLGELNAMWEAWGIDEGLIYSIQSDRFPLALNVGNYTIGPGGMFNAPRPQRIYQAIVTSVSGGAIATTSLGFGGIGYAVNDTGIVLDGSGTRATYTVNTVDGAGAVLTYTMSAAGTGYLPANGMDTATGGAQPGVGTGFTINVLTVTTQGQNRNELKIIEQSQYYRHTDLSATAMTPEELYPDYNDDLNGFMRLYLWPVPSLLTPLTLELNTAVTFSAWTLTASYALPPGFQDALQYALAWRLLARFGAAVAQSVAAVVGQIGQKAEARIRTMNAGNRQQPALAQQAQAAQPAAAGQ